MGVDVRAFTRVMGEAMVPSKALDDIGSSAAPHIRLLLLFFVGLVFVTAFVIVSSVVSAQESGTLDSGDRVKVTVFGEEDLSGEFEIDSTGEIAMPLIGKVAAAGGSVGDLEDAVETALLEGYLRNPRVSVEVLSFRSIFVLGEVNRPGSYPYSVGLTALKAVALAGGFTYRAKKNGLLIQRAIEPEKGEQKASGDIAILPGDIIRVRERFF